MRRRRERRRMAPASWLVAALFVGGALSLGASAIAPAGAWSSPDGHAGGVARVTNEAAERDREEEPADEEERPEREEGRREDPTPARTTTLGAVSTARPAPTPSPVHAAGRGTVQPPVAEITVRPATRAPTVTRQAGPSPTRRVPTPTVTPEPASTRLPATEQATAGGLSRDEAPGSGAGPAIR